MRLTGVCVLMPAAGRGARFGAAENKVFAPLLGRPLLGWTLAAFAASDDVDDIVLIGCEDDIPRLQSIGQEFGGGKFRGVVRGGDNRSESVRNGLEAIASAQIDLVGSADYVLIHDAARCCITPDVIRSVADLTRSTGAATAAVPVSDTLRHKDGTQVPRERLWSIQTPQGFEGSLITAAHAKAAAESWQVTDDASLADLYGHPTSLVMGSPENIKVTHPEDLKLAEAILMRREHISNFRSEAPPFPVLRVGNGYDVHRFAAGRRMFLGGVEFPEAKQGLLGHSDADVLLHALCDALLGAAGLGDIGVLFPPSDTRHKDRPSIEFLQVVKSHLDAEGWTIANVDVTVLAETPKIGPRASEIKEKIATVLDVSVEQIGIKATTNEGMGFVGRGEGIAAHASALLMRL